MPKSIEDRLDDALAKLDALQERLSPKERGADRINAEIRAAHNSAGSRDRRRLLDRITGRKTHEDQ